MIRNMTTFQKKIIPGAGNSRVVLGKAPSDFFVLFFNCETLPLPGAILVFNQDFYMENDGGGKICRKPIQTTSRHYFRAVGQSSPTFPF